jgi:class 3 adenylate cyclase
MPRMSGRGLPSGTVTLLLADIEGSTRMWERDSAEARSAMSELDALVDELVAKFDGARPIRARGTASSPPSPGPRTP